MYGLEPLEEGDLVLAAALAIEDGRVLLGLDPQVEHQGRIATVVDDEVGPEALAACRIGEGEGPIQEFPVLLQGLGLPGEDRDALGRLGTAVPADDYRRCRLVLGGEDVAARPADVGAELG